MKPTNYPMKNPRFPWKYKILEWKCEYVGHYDLEIGFNQAEPDVRFDHAALKEVHFKLSLYMTHTFFSK